MRAKSSALCEIHKNMDCMCQDDNVHQRVLHVVRTVYISEEIDCRQCKGNSITNCFSYSCTRNSSGIATGLESYDGIRHPALIY
jgi:hypothetical protein